MVSWDVKWSACDFWYVNVKRLILTLIWFCLVVRGVAMLSPGFRVGCQARVSSRSLEGRLDVVVFSPLRVRAVWCGEDLLVKVLVGCCGAE